MIKKLQALCALEGVSGREEAVRAYILKRLEHSPAPMDVSVDALGSVIARITGRRRASQPVLFAAHMDEVGLIVTGVTDEGFLRVAAVGGVDARVLYGHRVTVNGHAGVMGGKAVHQCSAEEKKKAPAWSTLLLDVGADDREAALQMAHPGDVAVFDGKFTELEGNLVKARALDDRAGCALLLDLAEQVPEYDVTLAFTVQEEVGLRGARAVAFAVKSSIAVVIDATTAADTAGVEGDKRVCCIGGGPVVSFMDKHTLYDAALYADIRRMAEEAGVPSQTKTLVAGGNDASAIQTAGAGTRVAAVSLPCRYIHSPACVLSRTDMENTLSLLRVLMARLPA